MILVTGGAPRGRGSPLSTSVWGNRMQTDLSGQRGEKASWEEFRTAGSAVISGSLSGGYGGVSPSLQRTEGLSSTRFFNSFWRSCWPDLRTVF